MHTGVPRGFEIALENSRLEKEAEYPGKGHFYIISAPSSGMHQNLFEKRSEDVPPRTRTGTRAHSPKPSFDETALLSRSERS